MALQRQGGLAFITANRLVNGYGSPPQKQHNLEKVVATGQRTIPVTGTAVSLQKVAFPAAGV